MIIILSKHGKSAIDGQHRTVSFYAVDSYLIKKKPGIHWIFAQGEPNNYDGIVSFRESLESSLYIYSQNVSLVNHMVNR